jgi:hypothetical protein
VGFAFPLPACGPGAVKATRVQFLADAGDTYHLYLWRDLGGVPEDACGLECARTPAPAIISTGGPSVQTYDWTNLNCPCRLDDCGNLYVGVVYTVISDPPDWHVGFETLGTVPDLGLVNLTGSHGDWRDLIDYGHGHRWGVENVIGSDCGPVPVEVASFEAAAAPGSVHLTWEVQRAADALGYNVLAAERSEGPYAARNAELLPAAARSFDDVTEGPRFYQLEVVERDGSHHRHGPVLGVPGARQVRTVLAQSAPNPLRTRSEIRFDVAAGERATIDLYDVRGAFVTRIYEGVGGRVAAWDGRDAAGKRVAPGVYVYRMTAGGESLSQKLVVLAEP